MGSVGFKEKRRIQIKHQIKGQRGACREDLEQSSSVWVKTQAEGEKGYTKIPREEGEAVFLEMEGPQTRFINVLDFSLL